MPTYIPLREFSENTRFASIEDLLASQWALPDRAELRALLKTGAGLILLDGLDEVAKKHNTRVLDQVNQFTLEFPRTSVIMTCRIAAREYTFEQFAEVEIADFERQQIGQFAQNWFTVRGQADKASLFFKKLEANPPMLELASSPLLLTLLCLIFEERTDFEGDRAELYREGLEVLLRKWDATRNIERDQPYHDLSLSRKQDLLSQIAHTRFENGEYFFDQGSLEKDIKQYFLTNSGKPVKASPEVILRAIEAQHGLLVARAHRIYSFSHLTFQEYLTAKRIFEDPNPEKWDALLRNTGDRRWREVMLLVASMVSPADDLLVRMFSSLDKRVAGNQAIHNYLAWVSGKSDVLHVGLVPAFVRAVYWSCGFSENPLSPPSHDVGLGRFRDSEEATLLNLDLARAIDSTQAKLLSSEIDAARDQEIALYDHIEIASRKRSVSERKLAQMINDHNTTQGQVFVGGRVTCWPCPWVCRFSSYLCVHAQLGGCAAARRVRTRKHSFARMFKTRPDNARLP